MMRGHSIVHFSALVFAFACLLHCALTVGADSGDKVSALPESNNKASEQASTGNKDSVTVSQNENGAEQTKDTTNKRFIGGLVKRSGDDTDKESSTEGEFNDDGDSTMSDVDWWYLDNTKLGVDNDELLENGNFGEFVEDSDDGAAADKRFLRGLSGDKRFIKGFTDGKRFMRGFNDGKRFIKGFAADKRFMRGLTGNKRFIKGFKEGKRFMRGFNADKRFMRGFNGNKRFMRGFNGNKRFMRGFNKKNLENSDDEKRFMRGFTADKKFMRGFNGNKRFMRGFNGNKRFMRGFNKKDLDNSNDEKRFMRGFAADKKFMRGFTADKRFMRGLTDKRFIKGFTGKRFLKGLVKRDGNDNDRYFHFDDGIENLQGEGYKKRSEANNPENMGSNDDKRFIKGILKRSDGASDDDKRFIKGFTGKRSDPIFSLSAGSRVKRSTSVPWSTSLGYPTMVYPDEQRFYDLLANMLDKDLDRYGGIYDSENYDDVDPMVEPESPDVSKRFMRGLRFRNFDNEIIGGADKRFIRGMDLRSWQNRLRQPDTNYRNNLNKRFIVGLVPRTSRSRYDWRSTRHGKVKDNSFKL